MTLNPEIEKQQKVAYWRQQLRISEGERDIALLDTKAAHSLIESLQKECARLREGWLAEERQREEKHAAVRKAGGVYQRLNGEMVLLIVDSPLLKTLETGLTSALSSLTRMDKIIAEVGAGPDSFAYLKSALIKESGAAIAALTSENPPRREICPNCDPEDTEFETRTCDHAEGEQ